jgi:hypothetical protein
MAVALCDEVRERCAEIAATARSVQITSAGLTGLEQAPDPQLDPVLHYLDGPPDDVARYFLTLDSINFGSGWFPTLRKQPGRSGYATIAGQLTERFRRDRPWSNAELRAITATTVADTLGQPRDHELMALYAQALRSLGAWLGTGSATRVIERGGGSAELLATQLASGMPLYRDPPFYKRAQLLTADLALAGVAVFDDLDRLTIFADNVIPHVLRCDGILEYDEQLAALIDSERLLAPGREEREIRACAVHACEQLAVQHALAPRILDNWLWNRGRGDEYKSRPRHRCRCVFY